MRRTSTFSKIGHGLERTAVEAVLCGILGASASYFLLKRKNAVELFGMDLPEWQTDGLLLAVESATGTVIGGYAIPYLEEKVVGNERLEKILSMGLPPAIVAGQHVLVKKYATDSNQGVGSEVLLSAGSKMTADYISKAFL